MKASLTHAVWVGVALLIPAVGAQAAVVSWDNGGTPDNAWETATNWNPNSLPLATDDVTIGAPYIAVLNSAQSVRSLTGNSSGGTLTINTGGNLTVGVGNLSQGAGVFNLNVQGGSITSNRFYNAPSLANSGMSITMTSGSISFSDRFQFNSYTSTEALNDRTVLNLSGGTFGSANFVLYGAYLGNRSQLNVTGSTLAFNVSGITLAQSVTLGSDPNISTALSFTVAGSTIAERSTIAKLNTVGGLVLDQNPLTVDFSNYVNAGNGGYSMTLIDYAGGLVLPSGTAFATPTFIYGSSGVTNATIVHDATNKLYRVDFAYVIPEPATLGLLAIGGLMMVHRGRR